MVEIGSMVEVPMKNSQEYAIVAGKNQIYDEGINYKPIHRIISTTPVLDPYQVYIIQEVSQKYMIPIHRVLGFFLPKNIINRLEKKGYTSLHTKDREEVSSRKENRLTIPLSSLVTPEVV